MVVLVCRGGGRSADGGAGGKAMGECSNLSSAAVGKGGERGCGGVK